MSSSQHGVDAQQVSSLHSQVGYFLLLLWHLLSPFLWLAWLCPGVLSPPHSCHISVLEAGTDLGQEARGWIHCKSSVYAHRLRMFDNKELDSL